MAGSSSETDNLRFSLRPSSLTYLSTSVVLKVITPVRTKFHAEKIDHMNVLEIEAFTIHRLMNCTTFSFHLCERSRLPALTLTRASSWSCATPLLSPALSSRTQPDRWSHFVSLLNQPLLTE